MAEYEVKLTYKDMSWCTVPLEIGRDEIGDTNDTDEEISTQMIELFTRLVLPAPAPVSVLAVHHQVAQKLHACTAAGSERAHDLVDLQLLDHAGLIRTAETKDAAQRLFASRRAHAWPPTVTEGTGWDTLYADQAAGMNVLATVGEAIVWTRARLQQSGGSEQVLGRVSRRSRRGSHIGNMTTESGCGEMPPECRAALAEFARHALIS